MDKKLKGLHYQEEFSVFGDPDAQDPDPEVRKRFFGKYRGTVILNVDPLSMGRLTVMVPAVSAVPLINWAMPCVPMAGPFMGTYFKPPLPGTGVWVEFEQGDFEHPIWVGCFWGAHQLPPMATAANTLPAPTITCETFTSGISISDSLLPPGGQVNLHVGMGTFVTLGADGVTIVAPSVTVSAPRFSVNGKALSVGLP